VSDSIERLRKVERYEDSIRVSEKKSINMMENVDKYSGS